MPVKETVYNTGIDRKANIQFSCSPLIGTTLFPETRPGDEQFDVEASAVRDSTSIALEVEGDTLKFLTNTSVETGSMEPAKFQIIENTDKRLTALGLTEGTTDRTINALVVDKKTGLGVWSKTSTTSLIPDVPNSQAYYYSCN
ncbi:hypothetical protein A2Z33_05090 [Candidatus Gottesmanbacteria bacterium RBG_16_52_11]|uniref:Uncharacterized protein n=1 Tax=Candidatus Gottesmanbacteria bacterium RBG_16_52_11 TaxID=1798374 RepID=A0A1F5YQY4_9BACT|nr:MAG: hypothetical protein A2Z33_05090 [Candidatus Gottesmanbacteria bacterium RBG_16_52_11]